ncbi:MAG: hydantoinase/oxoprolinase family protein [Pseudomonadota bacterium]
MLKVGPRSAGAAPGPACYGRGGTDPTVTDANLVLGFLDPENFAGGTIAIDRKAAEAAIQPLAARAGVSVPELAWGIHSVVDENMAAAARVHVAERGHHAGDFALLVTGGGGPLHGCEVAQRLGIARVICPPSAGVASALGLLMAPARIDRVTTVAKRFSALDWSGLEQAFQALERDARAVIGATVPGATPRGRARRRPALRRPGLRADHAAAPGSLRYALGVRVPRRLHGGLSPDLRQVPPVGEIELINIRVALTARIGQGELDVGSATAAGAAVAKGKRAAWVGAQARYVEMPVYERLKLGIGAKLHGPAIIEEASSTLILPPDARALVDDAGNIVVELPARTA